MIAMDSGVPKGHCGPRNILQEWPGSNVRGVAQFLDQQPVLCAVLNSVVVIFGSLNIVVSSCSAFPESISLKFVLRKFSSVYG